MKFYILDDDVNIVKILKNIVESDFNREVSGYAYDPKDAVGEIFTMKPDVVLLDYLMPGLDGVDVLRQIKDRMPDTYFVMISQVSDKVMVEDAYKAGISFFISKPINRFEVDAVIRQLEHTIETTRKLKQIISLVGNTGPRESDPMDRIKQVLRDVGMYSEKGTKDILSLVEKMLFHRISYTSQLLDDHAIRSDETVKVVRQRMRRAISKGVRNVAYLGIEDYMNDQFVLYANRLFDFECIKLEMDFIRGLNQMKSPLSIERFMENLTQF